MSKADLTLVLALLGTHGLAWFGGWLRGDRDGYDRAQKEKKEPLPKSLDWLKVHREKEQLP
jgi:hypothetical protein